MCKNVLYNINTTELHTHTHYSNIKLIDSTNFVEDLILKCAEMNKNGVALTEHESISSHIRAIQTVRKFKKEGKIPESFRLILGNEIYLVDSLEEVRDNYQPGITKFPHFLLLAKDANSHRILRELSSEAWKNSFYSGPMERTPTIKADLEKALKENPMSLIGSSACLGSESSIHILNGDYDKARDFLRWCADLFGANHFYLELQPGAGGEQKIVNEWLVKFSVELDIPLIITSDSHYLRPEDADTHEAFLNSKDEEREVRAFYENTYLHTTPEMFEKLSYLDEEVVAQAMRNTNKIKDMIEDYTFEAPTVIPKVKLPEFKVRHIFKQGYEQYTYIEKMANSDKDQDRYLLHLIEEGFIKLLYTPNIERKYFHEILARINVELEELWEISVNMKQEMSSYYNTIHKIISIIWADDCGDSSRELGGVVGSGRGSASGFLINYLLEITSINPLVYGVEMPHWRHLHKSRDIDALDIDIDVPPHLRTTIFDRMKEEFGHDRVAQVCTFGTVASKSAIQTACRGLGYDMEDAQYISSLIPFERGENWSIEDCLFGNIEKERLPNKQFINEVEKYPRLREVALKIEGLIDKRSIHAGGIVVTNDPITESNAFQRAPNGTLITQLNLDDTQSAGSIKYDILGVNNISKLQLSLDYMLDAGMIEWQGTLRKTFNTYFHPDNLDLNQPKYYELLGSGNIPDLFQFDTPLATQALVTSKPTNLIEMAAVNSLMRLMGDGNETPVETFTRYKSEIQLWYDEMAEYNLTEEEVKLMEEYLLPLSGIAETQELAMQFAIDDRIAGLGVPGANAIRKAIAKKSEEAYEEAKRLFYEGGGKTEARKELLDYIWEVQIGRQRGYSFSILHTIAYSIIGLQNIEIVANYSPIIWNTACLSINSGSLEVEEGEKSKNGDYGKVASAIAKLKKLNINIEPPLINTSNYGFTPDVENDRIIFSLKGISGIGDEVTKDIIAHRPYKSFDDFHERLYNGGLVKRAQMLQLIKAGCFNEFDSQPEIMKQFLVKEVDVKDSLNGLNMPRIIGLGLLENEELVDYQEMFHFRTFLKKNVHQTIAKPKNRILFLEDDGAQDFMFRHFSGLEIEGYEGDKLLIDEKKFDKEYKKIFEPLMEMINEKEFLRKFNIAQFHELWNQHAQGTVAKWQMESVIFYHDEHELDGIDFERYGITKYSDIGEEPIVTDTYMWRGRERENHKIFTIVGTVIDKNKNKNTATVITPGGETVLVKTHSGGFSHYDRQIKGNVNGKSTILERSWFTRGNLLLLNGYRQGDMFRLKAARNSNQRTINRITEVRNDGSIGLQDERLRGN